VGGMAIQGFAGSTYNFTLVSPTGSDILANPIGTVDLLMTGALIFGGSSSLPSAGTRSIHGAGGTVSLWQNIPAGGTFGWSINGSQFMTLNASGLSVDATIVARRSHFYSTNSSGPDYGTAALEVRELNLAGAGTDNWTTAPRLSFHWGGRIARQIGMNSAGQIAVLSQDGTDYGDFYANQVSGYNLYASNQVTAGVAVVSSGQVYAGTHVTAGNGNFYGGTTGLMQLTNVAQFLDNAGSTAIQVRAGSLLISNNYAHASNVPASGIWSLGDVNTAGSFNASYHARVYGWFYNETSGAGMVNAATACHFMSEGAGGFTLQSAAATTGLTMRAGSTVYGYLYGDSSGFGLLFASAGWGLRCNANAQGGTLYGNWTTTGMHYGADFVLT
jgi:hypothetical protein